MKGDVSIAVHLAPKEYHAFKRWHKAACKLDNLTVEQRWVKMGNNVSKSDTSTKKKK